MMYGVFQDFGAYTTRVKGSRNKQNAAIMRIIPMTETLLVKLLILISKGLTIKLNEVVGDGLEDGPARLALFDQARSLGFAVHEHHDTHSRKTAGDEHEDESTICPSPIAKDEYVTNGGASKGCGDARRLIYGEDDHPVPERCDIGSHDVGNV